MTQTRLVHVERVLLAAAIVLALALRLAVLDGYSTADEVLWRARGIEFGNALASHAWQSTYQAGHPGVVTMWLGAIADRVEWLQKPAVWDGAAAHALMQSPVPAPGMGVAPVTLGARRLVAIVIWLGLVALYALVRKLFDRRVAILATVLVGLDPFFLAHSRLHHLDGLLATFAALSALCLLVYQWRGRRARYLLASAAAAGLAMANKSPGVLLIPWAGLVLVLPTLWKARSLRSREVWRAVSVLALWLAGTALVLVAIWPAMWVQPLSTLEKVFGVAKGYAETPHENSNYFWFAIRPDPGPAFYPVAWAFRTTPWVLVGLLGLVWAWRQRAWRAAGAMMLVWALLFTAAMSVGDKKFDRYLLPVFALLDILAAAGWVGLAQRWLRGRAWETWLPVGLAGALAVGQLILLWPSRPYYLPYYNPVLGGSRTAPRVMLVGWGEGVDLAAAYLNAKPDARELVASCWHRPEFAEFFVGKTSDFWQPECLSESDYFVVYLSTAQRDLMPPEMQRLVAEEEPEHVVSFGGIEYAAIYRNTIYREAEEEIIARIAGEGDAQAQVILVDGNDPLARGYSGPVPLAEFAAPKRDDALRTALAELSAGRRHVWHLIYPDGCEGGCSRLAKQLQRYAALGEEIEVGGVRALRYDLPAEPGFIPALTVSVGARLGGEIALEGYDITGTPAPGETLKVRLHWRADAPVGTSYTVFAQLLGPDGSIVTQDDGLPQGGWRPTTTWTPGQPVLDEHEFALPADMPPGTYSIAVGLYDLTTMERLKACDVTGQRLPADSVMIPGIQISAGS